MASWEAFVNLDSLEQVKNRDRITVCRVSAVSRSDKVGRYISYSYMWCDVIRLSTKGNTRCEGFVSAEHALDHFSLLHVN